MRLIVATAAALALLTTTAFAKPLPDCDSEQVERTLLRVTEATTVIESKNVRSTDPDNLRFCKAEILMNNRLWEVVFELTWTSETEGRFWLKSRGGRLL